MTSMECPFTLQEYRSLIRLAKQRYRFVDFDTFAGENEIIWRHDVEYSLHEMHRMAEADLQEGIVSVLFVQIRSPFYNGLSAYAKSLFSEWIAGGLRIGLHFDWEFFRNDLKNLERHVRSEKEILEQLISTEITSFSYHNPNDEILAYSHDMAGMMNAYHPRFFNSNGVHYISDSNGRWRSRNLREVLSDPGITRLQVNLHDSWWCEDRIPQIDKLQQAWNGDAAWKMEFYRRTAAIIVDRVI